jgi:hypothetical protein
MKFSVNKKIEVCMSIKGAAMPLAMPPENEQDRAN